MPEPTPEGVVGDHLVDSHGYAPDYIARNAHAHDGTLEDQHTRLHEDETGAHLNHRHDRDEDGKPIIAKPEVVEPEPGIRMWLAVDFAANHDASTVLAAMLNSDDRVISWRVINPASEADVAEFTAVGEDLRRTFEEEGPMEDMFAEEVATSGGEEETSS